MSPEETREQKMDKRSIEFTILVTLKQNLGIFGVMRTRHEFRFCADSADDARALACSNVPSRGYPHDVREIQVLDCIPVSKEVFPVQGAQLRSLREVQSERDELEAA